MRSRPVAGGRLNHRARCCALMTLMVTGAVHAAAAQDLVPVAIRIYDAAGIEPGLMDRSRARVEAIFERAGIRVEWRYCDRSEPGAAGCNGEMLAYEVVVRLLPGPPALSSNGCGVALVPATAPAHFITLFVECLRDAASALTVAEDVVLAGTLAHEIGHVLLGPEHGPHGLMQARPRPIDWQRAACGGLQFTAAESRRLRQALMERHRR